MLGYYRRLPLGAGGGDLPREGAIFVIAHLATSWSRGDLRCGAASHHDRILVAGGESKGDGDYFGSGREPVTVNAASDFDCVSCGCAPARVRVYFPARMARLP